MEAPQHPIAKCRADRGLTQSDLALEMGVDSLTVSRWERGESLPRRRFWRKLEDLTGKPIADIIAATKPVAEAAE